ncbi:MAG: PH domain-containing protein [Chromatiales bacterium]|nr:PH domain-containing protein [Chromatiales bacterium]
MSHDDYAVEPVWGLPGALPPGETLLWQGQPRWQALAVRVFHARKVALYFAVLAAWSVIDGVADGLAAMAILQGVATTVLVGAVAVGVLVYLARLSARTTVYSITSRRIVMRIGMALPTSINLPYTVVQSAALRRHRDGTGDLPITLGGNGRISYVLLWPHARPWHFGDPKPMLRGLAEPEAVAELLSRALLAAAGPGGGTASPVAAPEAGNTGTAEPATA